MFLVHDDFLLLFARSLKTHPGILDGSMLFVEISFQDVVDLSSPLKS